jgi:Na+-driven multidrug efflux pump
LRQIFTKGAPVVAALSAKTAVLLSLSYAAASTATKRGDLAALAAHQILVGLYFVFAPVGDALSQTVQTFLPRSIVADQLDEVDRPPQKRSKALGPKSRAVVKGAVAAALVLGGLDAVMAWGLPAGLPTLFSRDPAVHSALRRTAPYLGSALMVHGLSSATEGTMLANRDAGVLGGLYAFDAAVVVAAFFAVARAAGPVTSVWRVFLGYNLLRCSQFALRVTSTALRRRKTA